MLKIKPNCETCDKVLPADSTEAYICSYECTFCHGCVETLLENVCPNCGGGLSPRPIRPKNEYRKGVGLDFQPASVERVHTCHSHQEIKQFSASLKHLPPEQR